MFSSAQKALKYLCACLHKPHHILRYIKGPPQPFSTAPSALLSYINTRNFFNNTREVLEKQVLQATASHTSRVLSKNPKCLYNSTVYEEQVFYFFYKMYRELRALELMT